LSLFRKLLGKLLGKKAEKKSAELLKHLTQATEPTSLDPERPWKTLGRRQPRMVHLWDRSMFKSVPSPIYSSGVHRRNHGKDTANGDVLEVPVEYSGTESFRTSDGHTFAVHMSGAFVRTDKDRRPVKQRKAAARAERAAKAAKAA
jgi:hypothetical protein